MRVARYLRKRMLHAAFLLLGISALSFAFAGLAPGTFLDDMKLNPQISAETLTALKTRYGLDQSLAARYGHWISAVARGDLGYSFAYNVPVATLLRERTCNTLLLAVISTMLAWSMAFPIGIWTAVHRRGATDRVCSVATGALLSIPEIALTLVLLLMALRSGVFAAGGMHVVEAEGASWWSSVIDLARHIAVPALALALSAVPVLFRHIRSAVSEALEAPFVRAARAHGIGSKRLLLRHALPVAANPVITLFGLSLGTLISGSLVVEVITGWPGLGPLFLESIFARDFYVVTGIVLLSAVVLVVGNIVADLLLVATDPRIQAEQA
jgi:peptide/nickel transport system permease protein